MYWEQIGNHIFCVVWCKFHTSTASSLLDMRKSVKIKSSLLGAPPRWRHNTKIMSNSWSASKIPSEKREAVKKFESGEIMKQPNGHRSCWHFAVDSHDGYGSNIQSSPPPQKFCKYFFCTAEQRRGKTSGWFSATIHNANKSWSLESKTDFIFWPAQDELENAPCGMECRRFLKRRFLYKINSIKLYFAYCQ